MATTVGNLRPFVQSFTVEYVTPASPVCPYQYGCV